MGRASSSTRPPERARAQRRPRSNVRVALLAIALPLAVFLPLAVYAARGEVAAWDSWLSEWIHAYENRETVLDAWANPLDLILNPLVQVLALLSAGALSLVLLARGKRRLAVFVALGVAGATILGPVLKEIVGRPPMDPSGDGEGDVFPSGHALRSMAVAGAFAVVGWPTRWRLPVAIAGGVAVALIGVAVVYHEWHWATDVLGGWSLAAAWLGFAWLLTRPRRDAVREAPKHHVAIYTASSGTAGFYDRSHGRAGGAERQMTLLARALVERGYRVAHVIYPPREPVELDYPLTLVHRAPYAGGRPVVGGLREAAAVWRALRQADAEVVVVRTASPLVGIAALFAWFRRRALVFSGSNVSDFTLETMSSRVNRALYRFGLRRADAVVVQSDDQRSLALDAIPSLRRVVPIPSFAELPPVGDERAPGEAFLWFGRSVPEKQPLRFAELARAVPEARFRMIPVPQDEDTRLLDELRSAAEELPNLELLDPLPHAEVGGLVGRSVAVVNTSTLEGMPNTFLEAWASGVPVLTLQFDPDGTVERHGLGISAAGSWETFVEGARELWRSRSNRHDLARRVRSYVESAHSEEAVAARWSALVDEIREARRR